MCTPSPPHARKWSQMARPRLSHPRFVSTFKLLSHGPSPYPYVWVISCFFVLFNFKGSQILVRVKYSVIS